MAHPGLRHHRHSSNHRMAYLVVFLQVNTFAILRINNEDLSIVPQPLADRTIGPSYGSFYAFGYNFQLPWLDANRLNNLKYVFVARSSEGDAITFTDPSTGADLSSLIKKSPDPFLSIFNSGEIASPYAFLREELFKRPQDISFFVSRRHVLRTCLLVRFKWVELATGVKEIEAIDTPYVRGFEYKKKDGVTLKLFDISDRPLDIRFTSSKSPIPQSEINAFIFSLRPASEEPRKSST